MGCATSVAVEPPAVVEKQEIKVEPEKKVVSPSKGESHAKKNEGNNVKNNVNADKNVKKEEVVEAEPVQKTEFREKKSSQRRSSTGNVEQNNQEIENVVRKSRRHSQQVNAKVLDEVLNKPQSASIRVSLMHQKRVEKQGDRVSRVRQEGFTGGDVVDTNKVSRKKSIIVNSNDAVIKKSLKEHPIFSNMDAGQLQCIVDAMVLEKIGAGKMLTMQGTPGKKWFCIDAGEFEITSKSDTSSEDDICSTLGRGDGFGEIFLFDCPRIFTVTSKTEGSVWSISRQNYRQCLKTYEEQNVVIRLRFLQELKLFQTLTIKELESIADNVLEETFREGEYIMRKDQEVDEYSKFYIICKGSVHVVLPKKNDEVKDRLKPLEIGSFFGERALLTDEKRNASIIAGANCSCLTMDRFTFNKILGSLETLMSRSVNEYGDLVLKSVPILSVLSDEERDAVMKFSFTKYFEGRQEIIKAGQMADNFYIIQEGEVSYTVADVEYKALQRKASAAENSELISEDNVEDHIMGKISVSENLSASEDTELNHALEKENDSPSTPPSRLSDEGRVDGKTKGSKLGMGRNMIMSLGNSSNNLTSLTNSEKEDKEKEVKMAAVEEDEDFNNILFKGDYFGEEAILQKSRFSFQTIGAVKCLCIPAAKFSELILSKQTVKDLVASVSINSGGGLASHPSSVGLLLKQVGGSRRDLASPQGAFAFSKRMSNELPGLTSSGKSTSKDSESIFKNLQYVGDLGKGAFGVVRLLKDVTTNKLLALKSLNRSLFTAADEKKVQHAVRTANQEKTVLSITRPNPFLVKFYGTSADDAGVYFILEFLPGGDLYRLLYDDDGNATPLSEDGARFYIAGIVNVFIHLHKHSIAYRDLKPENIMLDEHNYPKLVDFGFSKQVTRRTWTLCGTPLYLAPEVISCIGHDTAADWWTLGVLLYEMIAGITPFHGQDYLFTFGMILNRDVTFPVGVFSPEAEDFISKLLVRQKNLRMGSKRDHEEADILTHPFFKGFDWKAFLAKEIAPPIDVTHSDINKLQKDEYFEKSFKATAIKKKNISWLESLHLETFPTSF